MESPIKKSMAYGKGYTPKGIEALNKGKTKSSNMPPKKMGEMKGDLNNYKKPGEMGLRGTHKDMSSGQSMPTKSGDDNKKRYNGIPQSQANSMLGGERPTKFVC